MTTMILSSQAQGLIVPLWPDGVPNAKPSSANELAEKTDCIRISKVTEPTLEVYLPAPAHANGKAVLICPGGGYRILAYDKEGTDIAEWLNGQGIAGIVLKYRLPDDESNLEPQLSPLMDAQRGMELIRENADNWNIKPNKVGVMGFSAGGHLASTLSTHFDAGNKPDFSILIYPVITMKSDYTHSGSRENLIGTNPDESMINFYSNELQVTKETPATFIMHSGDDEAVPVENTLQYYKALNDNNVPAEIHLYPMGGHGYGLALGRERLENWSRHLADWLKAI